VGERATRRVGDFCVLSLFFVQRGGLDCQIYLTEDIVWCFGSFCWRFAKRSEIPVQFLYRVNFCQEGVSREGFVVVFFCFDVWKFGIT